MKRVTTFLASALAVIGALPGVAEAQSLSSDRWSAGDVIPVIDAAPGTVLGSRPAPPAKPAAGSSEIAPHTARIFSFATRDQAGRIREVGGVVAEPEVPWEGEGPRPTVVVAPGTVGQGDQCAPSVNHADERGGGQLRQVGPLLEQGFRVVVSDYIGLGTPGVHTYVNRVEQGRTLLDAARAGLAIDGLPADSPIAFWGYSQGGGATASAAEMAESYAPELNIVVTFAGAPPADLSEVLRRIDGNTIMGAIGYAVNGFMETDPEVRPLLDEIASPYGKKVLAGLEGDCIADSALRVGGHRTNSWTVDGRSLSDHFEEHPEIRAVLERNRIGTMKPNAPVLVLNGRNDDVIPHGQAERLARDWCALGADVTFVTADIPRILPGVGVGHVAPTLSGNELAAEFFAAAFGVALKESWSSGTPGDLGSLGAGSLGSGGSSMELPGTCQF